MSTLKVDKIIGVADPDTVEVPVGVSGVTINDLYNKSYSSENIITPYDIVSKGPATDARAFGDGMTSTTLALAIASIGSESKTLLIAPGTWAITGTLTFPSNICVWFMKGAVFQISNSVTFNGPIIAGNYQIFNGGAAYVSSATPLKYDAWTGSTNNTITFQTWPTLPSGNPTANNHPTPKSYVDSLSSSPPGAIIGFGGSVAPAGFLLCDGSAVSRTTYSDLFAVIGETYGSGNGSTTFNLPDLKGNVPVGRDSTDSSFQNLNQSGGEKTHILSAIEINIGVNYSQAYTQTGGSYVTGLIYSPPQGHNNLQPYIVINFIIKY